MATRVTQSLVIALADRATVAARDTQSAVVTAASRSASKARATQSVVEAVASSPAKARVTQSAFLVMSPPPPPARVTASNVLVSTARSALARLTQALQIVVGKRVAESKARITQAATLIVSGQAEESKARVTQANLLLLIGEPACPSDLDGCNGYSFEKLKEKVLRLLGESPDDPSYWSAREVGDLVNEAYIALCRDSGAYEYVDTQTTVAGTAVYEYPAMKLKRLFYDGFPLRNVTTLEMDRKRAPWGEQGEVWGYATQQQGPLRVRLIDVPAEAVELEAWVVGVPDEMEDRCDTPVLPPWSHLGIAYGAAARALSKYGEHRSTGIAGAYRAIYDGYLASLKGYVENRNGR